MKTNHRKITENLGIITTKYNEKKYYVVYFNSMPNLPMGELGTCLGKGKKPEEALENALINMVNIEIKREKNITIAKNYLSNISFYEQISNLDVCKVKLDESIYDEEEECYRFVESEKFVNADIYLGEDGEGVLKN